MSKHTPGKWEVRIESEAAQPYCVKSDDYYIATVYMNANGDTASNARLIAAAPEMYEALKQFANNKLSPDNCSSVELAGRRVANIARAILAKIEGDK